MTVFLDVLPRLGLTEAESAFAKLKEMAATTGKEMGLSLGDGASAGLDKLKESAISAERVVSDANRKMATSAGLAEAAQQKSTAATEAATAAALAYADAERTVASAGVATLAQTRELDALRSKATATSIAATAASVKASDAAAKASTAARDQSDAAVVAAGASTKFAAAEDAKGKSVLNTAGILNGVGAGSFLAFGAAVGLSAEKAANFEQSQTKIVASAGETSQGIKQVSDGILQMAGTVGYSAGELSSAMYVVEKGGFNAAKGGLDVLKAAAQGANAEQADLAEVTKGLTISMNDFHFPVQNASDVMSKLVVATGASSATFQEFTGALHSVEPAAAAAGIKYEDLLAVIARGTKSGASADQVTENVRNAINSLSGAQKPARDAMRQMGIDADDVSQHLGQRGLAGTMQYLSDTIKAKLDPNGLINVGEFKKNAGELDSLTQSLSAMSPAAQKVAESYRNGAMTSREFTMAVRASSGDDVKRLQDFKQWSDDLNDFSKRFKNGQSTLETYNQALRDMTGTVAGQTIALQVTGENAQATNELIDKLTGTTRNADGTVKGFNETQETMNAKLRDAKAGFGAAAIQLGNVFLPAITDVIKALATGAQYLAEHKSLTQDVTVAVGALAGAWVIAKGVMVFTTIIDGLSKMKTAMFGVRDATKAANAEIALQGPAAVKSAGEVEGAAAGEVAAEERVGNAATGAASKIGLGITAMGAFSLGYKAVEDAVPWMKDNRGIVAGAMSGNPLTMLLGPLAPWNVNSNTAKDDAQAKLDARKSLVDGKQQMVDAAKAAAATTPTPGAMDVPTPPSSTDPGISAGDGGDGSAGGKKPKGDKNDPIWIAPQNADDFKGDGDHGTTGSSIIENGPDFSPKGIGTFFSALLIDLALGNPLGKTMADKKNRGESASNPMYVSSVDVDRAQTELDKAIHNNGPDSEEAKHAAAKLQATQAAVGTTGGYYDPKTGTVSAAGATNQSQDQVAAAIIQEGQKRGLNRDQIIAGLDVAKLESNYGANPASHVHQNQSGTDVEGIFQQDPGYSGNHDDPHNAAGQFFDRFIARGGTQMDPYSGAVKVQVGTYGGDYVRSQNQGGVYDRLAPQAAAPGGPADLSDVSTGGGGGRGFGMGMPEAPVFKRSPGDPAPGTDGSSLFSPGGILGGSAPGGGAGTFGNIGMPPGTPGGQTTGFNPINALSTSGGHASVGAHAGGGNQYGAAPGGQAPGVGAAAGINNAPRSWGSGKGATSSIGSSIIAAAGPMAAMAPGSAQAAQLLDRTIGYGAQVGGIAVEGLMQSLIPTGGGGGIGDPSKSVIGKLAGSVAGAHKSAPNSAGTTAPPLPKADDKTKQPPAGDTNHVGTQNNGTVIQGDMHVTTPDAKSFVSDKPENQYPTATR